MVNTDLHVSVSDVWLCSLEVWISLSFLLMKKKSWVRCLIRSFTRMQAPKCRHTQRFETWESQCIYTPSSSPATMNQNKKASCYYMITHSYFWQNVYTEVKCEIWTQMHHVRMRAWTCVIVCTGLGKPLRNVCSFHAFSLYVQVYSDIGMVLFP